MLERIAIMGTGSLGTVLGAFIAQHRQIDLIDANKAHIDALNKNGAQIVGKFAMNVPVKAITPDEMVGEYDMVIYMPKQTVNRVALPQIVKHMKKDGLIVTTQNGLPELAICEYWPENQVYGAPVAWGASYEGPGVSRVTSEKDSLSFSLGSYTGKMDKKLEEVKEVLEYMCTVHVSDNLIGLRWCKLLINATLSGLSTVSGGTFGEVIDNPNGARGIAHIGRECVQICKASGVRMEHFGTHDLAEIFDFEDEAGEQSCISRWGAIISPHRSIEASMLQDLRNRRKCEIDAINGIVSIAGRKYGVATPICDQVVEIVKSIEAGNLTYKMENLDQLKF